MGSIKIGNNNVSDIKFGNTQVTSVYLGTNLIWTGGAPPPTYSAELNAIIARANLEGFTLPSAATLTACDALITAMKAINTGGNTFWGIQDRFYNFAYNNTALTNFSRIDWKTPATSPLITVNGGMGYQAGGFIGNNVDGYLDTLFVPSVNGVNYTQQLAGRALWVYSGGTFNKALDGNSAGQNRMIYTIGIPMSINCTSNLPTNANMIDGGLKGMSRGFSGADEIVVPNNRKGYNLYLQNSNLLPSVSQYILRGGGNYGDSIISMYFIGGNSYFYNSNFIDGYNTYLSAVGLVPNTDA